MPVQKFAPLTKDYATFDCDAHISEPPTIWERAREHLTKSELGDLKAAIWFEPETQQFLINGKAFAFGPKNIGGLAGAIRLTTVGGPGVTQDIQRALHVRNLRPETAISKEESAYLDHHGAYEPKPRLRDMDVQGIDQVMILPSFSDNYPWLQDAMGARAWCKVYNDWAYEYTQENPERLYFAALLPMQVPKFAVEELYRVAATGCRVCIIRPMDAMGNYPLQPKYEPLWNAMEETGVVYGMHPGSPIPSTLAKPPGYTEQHSANELIQRANRSSSIPHTFFVNMQAFMAEASVWVTMALMSGFFERHAKLKAAVFESGTTWLSFILEECDKAYRLHRNDRQMAPLKRLPSETFLANCSIGFEGEEVIDSRVYENIAIWASDVYHHDSDDAWTAIETMREVGVPDLVQSKMIGDNARRLYNIKAPGKIIRDRVTEIPRPDWWPTEDEIKEALKPESAVVHYAEERKRET